jgi:hypothetical protein
MPLTLTASRDFVVPAVFDKHELVVSRDFIRRYSYENSNAAGIIGRGGGGVGYKCVRRRGFHIF